MNKSVCEYELLRHETWQKHCDAQRTLAVWQCHVRGRRGDSAAKAFADLPIEVIYKIIWGDREHWFGTQIKRGSLTLMRGPDTNWSQRSSETPLLKHGLCPRWLMRNIIMTSMPKQFFALRDQSKSSSMLESSRPNRLVRCPDSFQLQWFAQALQTIPQKLWSNPSRWYVVGDGRCPLSQVYVFETEMKVDEVKDALRPIIGNHNISRFVKVQSVQVLLNGKIVHSTQVFFIGRLVNKQAMFHDVIFEGFSSAAGKEMRITSLKSLPTRSVIII